MIDKFIEGKPFYEISWELNRLGVKTNKGGIWHENSVRRILLQETHLGKIISNKSEGSGHKNKKTKTLQLKPREEWIIVENCHEAIKTEEEHEFILSMLSKRRRVPLTSVQVKLPFTSVIHCSKCKRKMQIYKRRLVNSEQLCLKPCMYTDPFGNRCGNSGGNIEFLIDVVMNEIESYYEEIKIIIEENKSDSKNADYLQLKIDGTNQEILKKEKSIERIDLAFEEGLYDLEKYKSRISTVKNDIEKLKHELKGYKYELDRLLSLDLKEKLLELEQMIKKLKSNLSHKEMNEVFKKIGLEITWLKNGKGSQPEIEINFTK